MGNPLYPMERILWSPLTIQHPTWVPGSLEGTTIYVSLFPCNECAKAIIQAGIRRVIYGSDKYDGTPGNIASKRLFDAAGVEYRQYEATGRKVELEL